MKITLVTNAHISYNPRLLKEADALCDAGHDVRVVAVTNDLQRMMGDEIILAGRGWRCTRLNFAREHGDGRLKWAVSGLRMKAYTALARVFFGFGTAEKAFCRYLPETARAVMEEKADLYIAHNLQALPVAAKAARAANGLLGFDVEDFHVSEDSGELADSLQQKLKEYIMGKYIRDCIHLSATSEAMADALVESFGVRRPVVIYNVFPLEYRAGVLSPEDRRAGPGSGDNRSYTAYWFSHVVSLDRGLQDFIRAMPLVNRRIELHLRGGIHGDAREKLLGLAAENGVTDQLHFHPPIHAEDLVRDASNYDFGLALEQPVSRNRLITVTNKIFTYILAGIAVIATDTPGQREVMAQAQGAGILYEPGDFKSLAAHVNGLLEGDKLMSAKRRAWRIGQSRFNWDCEKSKLLASVATLDYPVEQA